MLEINRLIQEIRKSNRQLQDLLIGLGDLLVASQEEYRYPQAHDNWQDIKKSIREDRQE